MLAGLKRDLGKSARSAGFAFVAGLLIVAGLAFLTVAAWIELARWFEPSAAAGILGAVYVAAGVIVLIRPGRRDHRPEPTPAPQAEALVQSFLTGMATGQSAASKRG